MERVYSLARGERGTQFNIWEEEVRACPGEGRLAWVARHILEGDRRSPDHPEPCSWDPDRRRLASVLASLERPEVGYRDRPRDPCPFPASLPPSARAPDSLPLAVVPRPSWTPRARLG